MKITAQGNDYHIEAANKKAVAAVEMSKSGKTFKAYIYFTRTNETVILCKRNSKDKAFDMACKAIKEYEAEIALKTQAKIDAYQEELQKEQEAAQESTLFEITEADADEAIKAYHLDINELRHQSITASELARYYSIPFRIAEAIIQKCISINEAEATAQEQEFQRIRDITKKHESLQDAVISGCTDPKTIDDDIVMAIKWQEELNDVLHKVRWSREDYFSGNKAKKHEFNFHQRRKNILLGIPETNGLLT